MDKTMRVIDIRTECLYCMCDVIKKVSNCTGYGCALHQYRNGQLPEIEPTGRLAEEVTVHFPRR